jgi:hypothetical protein
MAIPAYIQKTLVMKPEVSIVFDDLEAWHDHCRFELMDFNPADLYKSQAYRDWARGRNTPKNPRYKVQYTQRRDDGRKPYRNNGYQRNDRFSN